MTICNKQTKCAIKESEGVKPDSSKPIDQQYRKHDSNKEERINQNGVLSNHKVARYRGGADGSSDIGGRENTPAIG